MAALIYLDILCQTERPLSVASASGSEVWVRLGQGLGDISPPLSVSAVFHVLV